MTSIEQLDQLFDGAVAVGATLSVFEREGGDVGYRRALESWAVKRGVPFQKTRVTQQVTGKSYTWERTTVGSLSGAYYIAANGPEIRDGVPTEVR